MKWLEEHLEGIALFGISPQKATRERHEIKVSTLHSCFYFTVYSACIVFLL